MPLMKLKAKNLQLRVTNLQLRHFDEPASNPITNNKFRLVFESNLILINSMVDRG